MYKTSEYKFAYNCYGTACTEVEVDVLTGQTEVLRVDILYDCGDRYVPTKHYKLKDEALLLSGLLF